MNITVIGQPQPNPAQAAQPTQATQPTQVLAADSALALHAAPPATASLRMPVALTASQAQLVQQQLDALDFVNMQAREVAQLGSQAELALHRTLDGFLSKIDSFDNPRLFKLFSELKDKVDQEDLPALADRILNGKPGAWDQFKSFFSKQALSKALDQAWTETRRLAAGKTKTLVDLVTRMQKELQDEQKKLEAEIKNLEQLKEAYRARYDDFVMAVALSASLLEHARTQVNAWVQAAAQGQPTPAIDLPELQDKLQSLESRALALEGVLTRLPADQLVIRQLQNAGITTLQETTTTAASRFASIKMTLLTLHGALATKGVQKLAEQGAALDANLMQIRGQLMRDVVHSAANAPGDNRLAQAQQLRGIVDETRALVDIAEAARQSNQDKFAQARTLFMESRQEILRLGQQIRPDHALPS
jgi:uncharacterized protein YaaN involved in tellurite resistance